MLEKLTTDFINKIIIEINKQENKDKLEKKIIGPIFSNFAERIYPYVSLLFIMYTLNLILIIIILALIILNNKKISNI
jgi:hypothetical protein